MKISTKSQVLILSTFLMTCSFFAQAQTKRDVVYLKNGSIVKGNIIEMIPNSTLKIETSDGSIFIYKLEEVEKTEKETVSEKVVVTRGRRKEVIERVVEKEPEETFSPRGYFIMAKLGPSVRLLTDNIDFSMVVINGIQINEYLSLGLGVEYMPFSESGFLSSNNNNGANTGVSLLPVFLDTRFYIPKQRIHPMFGFQFGYTNAISNGTTEIKTNYSFDFLPATGQGGLYMGFGVGMRIFINDKISFLFDGGPSFQSLKGYSDVTSTNPGTYESRTITSMKVNVGVAISFGSAKKSSHE